MLFAGVVAFAMVRHVAGSADALEAARGVLNSWLLPLLMAAIVLFGFSRRIHRVRLQRLGVEVIDMGLVRDDPEAVERAFAKAAAQADAIVTSGGVSVGDADYVTRILEQMGSVGFWKVAIKPGRPLAFEARDGRLYADGKLFHVKGINWYGSEGRTGAPGGLHKHSLAWYMAMLKDNRFNAIAQPMRRSRGAHLVSISIASTLTPRRTCTRSSQIALF